MGKKFTRNDLPKGYEVCGIGSAPEEDSLVIMSDEAIRKLRQKNAKPGFFKTIFSGPAEVTGTGANPMESDFIDQELVERGFRKWSA